MYALVYVEPRYVSAFVVLLWLGAFSGVRLPEGHESRRLMACTTMAMMVIMILAISVATASEAYATARHLIQRRDTVAHVHWQIAEGLKQMGVQAGDQVAIIGSAQVASPWARLARVRIVAETPIADQEKFWAAADPVKSQVIESFASTGVKVIVAAKAASDVSPAGWQRIGNTGYYAYLLPR